MLTRDLFAVANLWYQRYPLISTVFMAERKNVAGYLYLSLDYPLLPEYVD